jgi:glutathione synthase/RimK-type ligase-like ATP-grasp enzyme
MTRTALRVATCRPLPEPDRDEAPLAAALAAGGFAAELVAWDDPTADWDAPIPTILRSTWNYPRALAAFLAWIDRASAAAVLINPPDVVRANVHKRYLLALAARGVPVVPTTVVERGQVCDLAAIAARGAAPGVVIKPEVGAASLDARRFAPTDPAALAHLAALTARGAALVQPYVASVDSHGERALVWIDGELSHAIRKLPRFAGDAERTEGPLAIAGDERAVALAALAPIADRILYGRVDLARDAAGRPMVMELELVEPSLYLVHQPDAAARLVAGLRRYLEAPPARRTAGPGPGSGPASM